MIGQIVFHVNIIMLRPSQYGFQSSMSTLHALIELVEKITTYLDTNKSVIGIFVDLNKAFDTINHNYIGKQIIVLWHSWCCT